MLKVDNALRDKVFLEIYSGNRDGNGQIDFKVDIPSKLEQYFILVFVCIEILLSFIHLNINELSHSNVTSIIPNRWMENQIFQKK